MIKLIKGIKEILNFIRTLFNIIMTIFKTIAMCFSYLIHIVNIAFTTISTLPAWLMSFATITICISIIYFIVGRNTGKSD